ncbi:cytochrome P450 2L1-like isoform X1 [Penaeus monodon]|uniref:cytochrome P450 2L1-like isoform X1 n=2 Tax=Penaeus monodon TaxID=6687 RepID=UPI0018A700EF|nr:cytochrome P450 2L1-like isoform X1 [Penaeus monodon]
MCYRCGAKPRRRSSTMLTEALLGILLLVLLFSFVNKRPENLPPGLWGLPIIGHLPSSKIPLHDQLQMLKKKFGNIISWRMGSRIFIFFCDYKTIKAAFSKPEFSNRPDLYSFTVFNRFTETGIIVSNGQIWQNNRRFTLRHLRDLGMGKTRLEEAIQREAVCLVEDFARHAGRPAPLPWSINVAVLNVIWQMVANRRHNVNDFEIQKLNKLTSSSFEDFQGIKWFDFMPWLVPIVPQFLKRWTGVVELTDKIQVISQRMAEHVKEHQATLDPENPRDYIDAYLLEMESQKDDPNSTMSIEDLLCCLSDLFNAGSETTSSTIRWAIYFLAKYPEVQARVQKEIDSVVPRDVLPSIQQKNSMPYLEAVTLDVHRLASFTRIGVYHMCSRDTQFEGYIIPKGAILAAHQEACHMDPAFWEKPYELYPEHFLDDQGKILTKKEGFLPFAPGRRQCLGESLARMELFVFLSALLQNFSFSAPKGKELSVEKDPKLPLLNLPKPVDIVITKRK